MDYKYRNKSSSECQSGADCLGENQICDLSTGSGQCKTCYTGTACGGFCCQSFNDECDSGVCNANKNGYLCLNGACCPFSDPAQYSDGTQCLYCGANQVGCIHGCCDENTEICSNGTCCPKGKLGCGYPSSQCYTPNSNEYCDENGLVQICSGPVCNAYTCCLSTETCVNSVCSSNTGVACGNTTCNSNQVCINQKCYEKGSTPCGQSACSSSETCINNSCYPAGSAVCGQAVCTGSQTCINYQCVENSKPCGSDNLLCTTGQTCTDYGMCKCGVSLGVCEGPCCNGYCCNYGEACFEGGCVCGSSGMGCETACCNGVCCSYGQVCQNDACVDCSSPCGGTTCCTSSQSCATQTNICEECPDDQNGCWNTCCTSEQICADGQCING